MLKTKGLFVLAAGSMTLAWIASAQQQPSTTAPPQRALLDKYCGVCHNDRLRTGGLSLQKPDPANVSESAEIWEKVVRKLRVEAMPPQGMPRPDKATLDGFASDLESRL